MAEQAAELSVKGLLHGLGRGPWGHDLVQLCYWLADVCNVPDCVVEDMRRLSHQHYISRHPDVYPWAPPGVYYGSADSLEALAQSERVLGYVDASWSDLAARDWLFERRIERHRLIELARAHAETVKARLPVIAVLLVGSVARGDFNVWSGVDVVVVAEALPEQPSARGALLKDGAPAGVQVVGFTRIELRKAAKQANRLVLDLAAHGILLTGDGSVIAEAFMPTDVQH